MNCRQSRRLFGAYWDDEITQAEREALDAHLSGCRSCRERYDALARTLELVSGLPRVEAAPDLAERVLARARHAGRTPDRLPSAGVRWVPLAAAAALMLVSGVAAVRWAALRSGPDPANAPVAVRVAPAPGEPTPATGATGAAGEPRVEEATLVAGAVPDSLFDHSEDVEFILDPVTVRRGRAHPATRLAPPIVRGEQATITF